MCRDNTSLTPAQAEQMKRALDELLDWEKHRRAEQPTDQEIAARVRKIWASAVWTEIRKVNPGHSDLDLLELVVKYGSLWDAVMDPLAFPVAK